MTVDDYDPLFEGLREPCSFAKKILESSRTQTRVFLKDLSSCRSRGFCSKVSQRMGFDFAAGRMDASTHPFSAGIWPGDAFYGTL